jgi:hypothetical protein
MNPYTALTTADKARYFCAWPAETTPALERLKSQVEIFSMMGSMLYPYVLQRGRVWEPAPLPSGIERGTEGQCFQNAALLAFEHPDRFIYVEGYAASALGLTVAHAWCATADGVVVDNTWAEPEKAAYLGIAFDAEFLRRHIHKTGYWGVFGEMPHPHMLATPVGDMVHERFRAEIQARDVWPPLWEILTR